MCQLLNIRIMYRRYMYRRYKYRIGIALEDQQSTGYRYRLKAFSCIDVSVSPLLILCIAAQH